MPKESQNFFAKKIVVKEISNLITNSEAFYLAHYHGLKVAQINQLRKLAKEAQVNIKIFKNRLFYLAAQKHQAEGIKNYLVGPNLFFFSKEANAGAKLIKAFNKENKKLIAQAGFYEGKVINAQELMQIAELPSYEEALTILAASLLAPLQKLAFGFKLLAQENKLVA